MTIKTLEFIHNLLQEEAYKRQEALNWIAERRNEAEENNAPNLETLKTKTVVAREKYFAASNALEAFESEEWK